MEESEEQKQEIFQAINENLPIDDHVSFEEPERRANSFNNLPAPGDFLRQEEIA